VLTKGIVTLFLSSITAIGISLLLNTFRLTQNNSWWISICIFAGMFFILHFFYTLSTDGKNYTGMLIATISVKLFILLIIIFIYSYLYPKTMLAFSVHFIAHYILFTVFEIRYLLHIIKNKSLKEPA